MELVLRADCHKNQLALKQEIVKNKFCEICVTKTALKAVGRQLID